MKLWIWLKARLWPHRGVDVAKARALSAAATASGLVDHAERAIVEAASLGRVDCLIPALSPAGVAAVEAGLAGRGFNFHADAAGLRIWWA